MCTVKSVYYVNCHDRGGYLFLLAGAAAATAWCGRICAEIRVLARGRIQTRDMLALWHVYFDPNDWDGQWLSSLLLLLLRLPLLL